MKIADDRSEHTELLAQFLCAYIHKMGGELTISVTAFNAIAGAPNSIGVLTNMAEDKITITVREPLEGILKND